MLVLKALIGLHETVQLQLLQHYWLTERGPLEKGMANHFSILALRTP